MAWFGACLSAEDALTVGRCVDALADTALADTALADTSLAETAAADTSAAGAGALDSDRRTRAQRRADGLVGLCRAVLERLDAGLDPMGGEPTSDATDSRPGSRHHAQTGTAPGQPGTARRPRSRGEVQLVVSAETVLGIGDAPGELIGHGPVSAAHARRIAHLAGMTWRRVLTDPVTGVVLDRGRSIYSPPAELAAHVLARFGWRCSRPGCSHRAADLDHATPWEHGGTTGTANLHGVCRGCHTAKHTGWRVGLDEAGATWTSPNGRRARTLATDLRPEDRLGTRGSPSAVWDTGERDWLAELHARVLADRNAPPAPLPALRHHAW